MSLNRVIGADGKIPWHLPEDFKWFKKMTLGNVVVMGRKTFESLGRPLPSRKNMILTRHPQRLIKTHPEIFGQYHEWRGGRYLKRAYQFHFTKLEKNQRTEILIFNSLDRLNPEEFPNDIFICGGAQIYEQALPRCSDLYLTLVKREVRRRRASSRRLKRNLFWLKKSATNRSSRFCITGTSRCWSNRGGTSCTPSQIPR